MDASDVKRLLIERVTPVTQASPQYARLIHQLTAETADEMRTFLREKKDLQQVERWLLEKTMALNTILERERVTPATPAYRLIRQVEDAAAHFVAEYRASEQRSKASDVAKTDAQYKPSRLS